MLLWRLSSRQHANAFDGGYGLLFDGRWNTVGRPVTYCSTSPSLCVLEKLVHVEDLALLPDLVMVTYQVPDTVALETVHLGDLSADWRKREGWTQQRGDDWHRSLVTALLIVPSAVVSLERSPDVNVLINHNHPESASIRIVSSDPFELDPRLL